jgi:phospholipase A1/A2
MRAWFALIVFVLASATPAAALEVSLVPEEAEVRPGKLFTLLLVVTNENAEPATYRPPPRLDLRVLTSDAEIIVSAVRDATDADEITVPAAGFIRVRYAGTVPEGRSGDVALRPVNVDTNAVALYVIPPEGPEGEARRLSTALSPYEPVYFSVGSRGETNARFQVSLKFRLFNKGTQQSVPLLEDLYLAYSQTSLWDLESSSKPFFDSSYRPSIFLLEPDISRWPFAWSRLGLQGGLEHESNGKEGPDSRSLNTAYVRPALTIPFGKDYFITLAPKVLTYLDKSENPDIDDYRGNVDFLIRLGSEEGLMVDTTLRKGNTSGYGSVQVDASYPLHIATFGNIGGYLHVQYFNGYGESLLTYNIRTRAQIRFGLMVTRGTRW